jgi:two-component system cell cycle sensor histidine kinase/response regulator CckA
VVLLPLAAVLYATPLISVIGLAFAVAVLALLTLRRVRRRRSARGESPHELDFVLSPASTGAWRWNLETDTSTRDAVLSVMLGLGAVEATERLDDLFARFVPEDVGPTRSELARAIRDRDAYSTVCRIVRPDGTIRWLRGSGRAFYDEAGTATHLIGDIRDTTDRNVSDEALRASEEKFAKAFQASPDLIAISDLGESGGIIEVNDRFEGITGHSRAEALGRSMADLGLIDASLRNAQLAIVRDQGSFRDFEFELRRKDGGLRTILASGEVIEIGGRQRLLTVGRDITYTKRAEEALNRSESKYRELVENANDVVFKIDPGGRCQPMNRAGQAIAGFAAQAPGGTHLADVVVPEDVETARREIERVLAGDEVPVFELDMLNTDGARVRFEVNLRPIVNDGAVIAAQGIARDVTVRTKLEQQLRQAQRMDAVGRLAAGIAHDFNNLLTVILGNCEVGASDLPPADPMRNTLHEIRESAERAAALTSQLLAFTRQQIIQPRILDANDAIADIHRMLTRLIGENIKIQLVPTIGIWHVRADPGQLQQILVDLVVNARDSMPDGGHLTIRTRNLQLAQPHVERGASVPPGDYVEITVGDTSAGMSQLTLERLFEPFYSTREQRKGAGLGLATVYGIVKQNDGFVFAESDPGNGSTFRILLPRADAPVTAGPREGSRHASSGARGPVLLVEDEDEVRELIGAYLKRQGYTVVAASSGEEAVDRMRGQTEPPILLISDIVMPGMNGRVLSDRLRLSYPGLKVLFVSGYTDDALVSNGSLPAGTHFLQKPFALSALASRVRDLVDAG